MSRVHLPLVLPVTPSPAPPCGTLFGFFYFLPVSRAFVPLAVFVLVNHHFPVVLSESGRKGTKGKAWSGSKLGRAGDGASFSPGRRAPARRRTLTPSTLMRRTPGAVWLCARFISLFNTGCVALCSRTMCLAPTVDPPRSLLPACSP